MRVNISVIIFFLVWIIISPVCIFAEEHRTIIVGDDMYYPPYAYLDENGNPTGFNVELTKALGRVLGYNIEFRLDQWSKVRQALEDGETDLISGMFYSPEREDLYSFSLRHTLSIGDIFSAKGQPIRDVEALRGQTVIVQRGDILAEYLDSLNLDLRLIEVATPREILALVNDGSYPYGAVLQIIGHYIIRDEGFDNIQSNNLTLNPSDYGFAVKKGNEDLLLEINSGLQILKVSGEYDQIYNQWIGIYQDVLLRDQLYKYRWIPAVFLVLLSFFMLTSMFLKRAVNRQTKELKEKNELLYANAEELEASLEELSAVEEELRDQYDRLLEHERALSESEERFKRIISALPDLVFVFNEDGKIKDIQASDVFELAMPVESFLDQNVADLFPQDISGPAIKAIKNALHQCSVERMEYELPDRSGQLQTYEARFVKASYDQVIGFVRNISIEKKYVKEIEYMSFHDQLTGLYNRYCFEQALAEYDGDKELPVYLLMADINGLKLVNDSLGPKVGDDLLAAVANVLKQEVPDHGMLFRIGGDEFVILYAGPDSILPEELITQICQRAALTTVQNIEISLSFGWDTKDDPEKSMYDVLKNAENKMHRNKLFEAPSSRGKTVHAIINTLHEKNKREEAHSRRVSELAQALAEALGMSERETKEIQSMGLLHDIGKVAIDESILNKEGKLTAEEYEEIKKHPEIGYRILSSVNDMTEMAEYVLYHHEKWDGSGYPRGIKAEDIPLQARIIAIVDAYDAMISERTYRDSLSPTEAAQELRTWAGRQFDPELVEIFIKQVLQFE